MQKVHTDVVDYVNLIELKEGLTLAQFKPIEPFDVRHVEVEGEKSVLISADYSGVIMWNTTDKYVYSWKIKMAIPLYLTSGGFGNAIAIAKDAITVTKIDTKLGVVNRETKLPGRALGKPFYFGSLYYIPIEGSLIAIDNELKVQKRYALTALKGDFTTMVMRDYIYLIGSDTVIKLSQF